MVGTSAGSVTGALLTAGLDLDEARRMEARLGDGDPPIEPDWERGSAAFAALTDDSLDQATIRRTVGRASPVSAAISLSVDTRRPGRKLRTTSSPRARASMKSGPLSRVIEPSPVAALRRVS